MSDSAAEIVIANSGRELAATADVICTLTPAREPLLNREWLRPGTHVNAVGAPPRSGYREMDNEVIRRSRVVVDSLPVALHESDAIRLSLAELAVYQAHIKDELGADIAGHAAARSSAEEITLFNSVGLALEDIATARLVVDLARRKGLGSHIALGASETRNGDAIAG